jgi:hypothetical protein
MEEIKHLINLVTNPRIAFPAALVIYFFMFPCSEFMYKLHRKLGLNKLWTKNGGIAMFTLLIVFFAFGLTDFNFTKIVTKPDNVPIVALIFLVVFFLWLSMKQAWDNDLRIESGKPSHEAEDAKEKILVWPDLVYIELIAMVLCSALLIFWAMSLNAPLEEPANPSVSPNPSKAPWYFLGLQEMLVYFDPWLAGALAVMVIAKVAARLYDEAFR